MVCVANIVTWVPLSAAVVAGEFLTSWEWLYTASPFGTRTIVFFTHCFFDRLKGSRKIKLDIECIFIFLLSRSRQSAIIIEEYLLRNQILLNSSIVVLMIRCPHSSNSACLALLSFPLCGSSKVKRDSSPGFEAIVDPDQLLKQKEEEIQRMQAMLSRMQEQLKTTAPVNSGASSPAAPTQ